MDAPFLSICIPTYNRQSELTKLVSDVSDQMRPLAGKVELIVLDNCSEVPAASYLPPGVCRVVRNPANIGSTGNILRAIETAAGQFVWLIGDDDRIGPGAIEACLKQCESAEQASHIYFSNCFIKFPRVLTTHGVEAFAAQFAPDRFGGLLWISSQAINRAHAIEVIRYAYAYPGSSPQIALALLNAHRTAVFSPVEIAIHTQANAASHWNPDAILCQMNQLLMLPVAECVRQATARALAQFLMPCEMHFLDVLKSYYCQAQDAAERTHIFLTRFRVIGTAAKDDALLQKTEKCGQILADANLRAKLYKQFNFGGATVPSVVSQFRTNFIP